MENILTLQYVPCIIRPNQYSLVCLLQIFLSIETFSSKRETNFKRHVLYHLSFPFSQHPTQCVFTAAASILNNIKTYIFCMQVVA